MQHGSILLEYDAAAAAHVFGAARTDDPPRAPAAGLTDLHPSIDREALSQALIDSAQLMLPCGLSCQAASNLSRMGYALGKG